MSRPDDFRGIDPRTVINRDADWHLNNWATWTEQYSLKIGFKGSSAVVCSRSSTSFDEMIEDKDTEDANVCDAVIDSLEPIHRAAIHNVYLRSIFRFRGDPLQVFVEAVERFWVLAQKRGIA